MATLALHDSHNLALLAQATTALTVEAMVGHQGSFSPFIHDVARPHPGQVEVARNIRTLLDGSAFAVAHEEAVGVKEDDHELRQDRYPLRTSPQFMGPLVEDLLHAYSVLSLENNTTTDNPLIDVDDNATHHGGNFQSSSASMSMEKTRLAMALVGKLAFTQLTEMLNASMNRGLPSCLAAEDPSLNYHTKGVDIATASYCSEASYLSLSLPHRRQGAASLGPLADFRLSPPRSSATSPTRSRRSSSPPRWATRPSTRSPSSRLAAPPRPTTSSRSCVPSLFLPPSALALFDLVALVLTSVTFCSQLLASHLYCVLMAVDLRALEFDFKRKFYPEISSLLQQHFGDALGSEATTAELVTKVKKALAKRLEQTSTYDLVERWHDAFSFATGTVVEHLSASSLSLSALNAWKVACAERAVVVTREVREAFWAAPSSAAPCLSYLAPRTRTMYTFVREELGVKARRGDVFLGRQEATIGSSVSRIYEAIRDGRINKVLVDMLA